jgi:hypothetical protein
VPVEELEVYITPSGLGRAAIAKRDDGFLYIYVHWIWDKETRRIVAGEHGELGRDSWWGDETPNSVLYKDVLPETGIYGTLDDARRQLRNLRGFSDAVLKPWSGGS